MYRLEFVKEPHIVFGEHAQVLHSVFQVGDAFYSHAERIAGVFFAVDSACVEHIGVDHTASEYFHPSGVLAESASLSAADMAGYVHFGRRLGEWEVRRTEAYLRALSEHLACKVEQRLFQVGERHVLVYIEGFHLMEEAMRACRDGFVSVNSARTDDAYRRFGRGHDT